MRSTRACRCTGETSTKSRGSSICAAWSRRPRRRAWSSTSRRRRRSPISYPPGTPLSAQLLNFQRAQERIGLIVDEYGEIEGLAALEDLLEEIVGQFTTDPTDHSPDVHPQPDGTFLVDGAAFVRELNRTMQWELPTDGPRTMNGLIVEFLGSIPQPGTSLMIAGYPIEILQTIGNTVRTARISPAERRTPDQSRR